MHTDKPVRGVLQAGSTAATRVWHNEERAVGEGDDAPSTACLLRSAMRVLQSTRTLSQTHYKCAAGLCK